MDVLSNVFSAIQNAQQRRHMSTHIPFSNHIWDIMKILYIEGYIEGFKVSNSGHIILALKYIGSKPCIHSLTRISRPGKRKYVKVCNLKHLIQRGLGSYIISTSSGVFCDRDARQLGLGGELIARVL